MDSKFELTVPGRFENLVKVSELIRRAAGQARLDERTSYAIQMAVDEACTNIIEHAYGGESDAQIRLICRPRQEGLEVTIYDWGKPFEPPETPVFNSKTPLEKRKSGGMGLFFIHNLVDKIEFKTGTSQGNQLVLFKRREQPS